MVISQPYQHPFRSTIHLSSLISSSPVLDPGGRTNHLPNTGEEQIHVHPVNNNNNNNVRNSPGYPSIEAASAASVADP